MKYRTNLPPIPFRMRRLPIERGYPVPWFVMKVNGRYDFRVADNSKLRAAVKERRCWVCGQQLGVYLAFTIGPMCAINRTIAEPPSHRECAEFSVVACPFLNQRESARRSNDLPENRIAPAGHAIMRQPGVALLWITKSYQPFRAPGGGVLFEIGDPVETHWYREGRLATREEVLTSIDSGYPILLSAAEEEGERAVKSLEHACEQAMALIPSEAAP